MILKDIQTSILLGICLMGLTSELTWGFTITCDEHWTGFSESPSCYRLLDNRPETFHDAKETCEGLDGTLVSINTLSERDFLATWVGSTVAQNIWVGLSYKSDSSKWVWTDGTDLDGNVIQWANETLKACAMFQPDGKLLAQECENTQFYVCEKALGVPVKCDTENDWEHYKGSCYKRYHHDEKTWDEARDTCLDQDSDLIVVNDQHENNWVYQFANRDQVDVWLGIHENASISKFVWVDGTLDGGEGVFVKWEAEQPAYDNGNMAGIMASSSHESWSTRKFDTKMGFVCEKPTGSFCLFDLVPHGERCYEWYTDFDANNHNWLNGRKVCNDVGMELLTVDDADEDQWVTQTLFNTGLFNYGPINGVWIGYQETGVDTKQFKRLTDNQTMGAEDFDIRSPDIVYNPDAVDCLYSIVCPDDPGDEFCFQGQVDGKRWFSDNCEVNSLYHLTACEMAKGASLDIPNLMHPKDYCLEGWGEPFAGYCYMPVAEEATWGNAKTYCKQNHSSSDLVSILSQYENEYVKQRGLEIGANIWIGYTDSFSENSWIWDDGSQGSYTQWAGSEPNGGKTENCAVFDPNNGWRDYNCGTPWPFVCKMQASKDPSGNPVLPDTSTMPPTTNCGRNGQHWVEDPETGMCYSLITDGYTWHDAREQCKILGGYREHGDLASINSWEEQKFFMSWFSVIGHSVSTWTGLNDLNQLNSYEWSDGTPFAFINWRDNEPSGSTENCGEFRVDQFDGQWNDYLCNEPIPAVCEKRGRNYIPPPDPTPPEPNCPDKWTHILDKCFYISGNNMDYAFNWTEAKEKCNGLFPGSALASVHSIEENQAIFEILDYTDTGTLLGGSDAEVEGQWAWDDGSTWDFDAWSSTEPNGGTGENCMEMNVYGEWNDIPCQENKEKPFVCESSITICPEHWVLYDGKCWKFSNGEVLPWNEARQNCQDDSGGPGDLVSIHSERENGIITEITKEDSWIGLQINGENDYSWSDGTNYDFADKWSSGEPNNFDTEKCTSLSHNDGGVWSTNNCEETKDYTCRFKSTHYASCPNGWQKFNGNCYLLMTDVQAMSFQDAEASCQEKNSHLASIVSNEEMAFLQSMVASYSKCGDYWTEDPERGLCYYYSGDLKSWGEANASCVESGSNLVKIDSEAKNNFLLSLVPQASSYWVGATDLANEGTWVWADQSVMDCNSDFCDWIPGEPNSGTEENCLEILKDDQVWTQGHWNDAFCDEKFLRYMCEMPMANEERKENVWIGLSDLDESQQLKWTDGQPVSYTKWASEQPYHHEGDSYQCVAVNPDNEMYMVECNSMFASVCKRPQEISTVPPDSQGCDEGQMAFEGSCYDFNYEHRTFSSAQSICQKGGGNLLTINTPEEQAKIVSLLAENVGRFFIGLMYSVKNSAFEWASGEMSIQDFWDHYQPDLDFDDGGGGKCVSLSTESEGFWYVWKCSDPRAFICEYPRTGYTNPPTTTTTIPPESQCIDGWTKYNDHCYKYFDLKKSFDAAEEYCNSKGGNLISVAESTEEVQGLNNVYVDVFLWIGARQSENDDGGYYWTDGTVFEYTHYKEGYPDSNFGSDNCLMQEYNYGSLGWENHACDSELPFVCETVAGMDPPTTIEPPTDGPDINCVQGTADGWIKRPEDMDTCYKFMVDSQAGMTWDDANMQCAREGGKLASIHSLDENMFIMVKAARQGIANAFIGLFLNDDDEFMWSDGSVPEFYHWYKGEPNNFNGMESCGVMYTDSGYWNDAHCSEAKNGFVCKKPASGDWTTAKPTPIPSGHCPSDHYEFKGYCFKIMGLSDVEDPSLYRNWTDARMECKALGNGYDLVSIHSDNEQAFLLTILAALDKPDQLYQFWIGLHDWINIGYTYDTFYWSDETSVDYINWAEGEPNNYDYDWADANSGESCVQMYGHNDYDIGHWNDYSCDVKLPYICKTKASTQNPNPPETPKCDGEYAIFDEFMQQCYRLEEAEKTWEEAEKSCKSQGSTHLTSILSIPEQAFMINKVQTEMTWIGLSDKSHHGFFKFSDGWPMQVDYWAIDPPPGGDEDVCVAMNMTDGKWYPKPCNEKYPSLCKHSEVPVPTPGPHGECPSSKFTDLDATLPDCYYLYVSTDSSSLTWDESNRQCAGLGFGSKLASIHSDEEMSRIHGGLLNKHTDLVAWIGLFTTAGAAADVYQWVDDTPYDFNNWEDGEPNSPGVELCVQAYAHNGKWNDAFCDQYYGTLGYLCKAPKVQVSTSSPGPTHTTTNGGGGGTTTPMTTTSHGNNDDDTTTTSKRTTTTTTANAKPPSKGISPGAVAAVVILCILVVAGGIVFIVMWKRQDSRLKKLFGYDRRELHSVGGSGFENIAYNQGGAANPAPSSMPGP